MIFLFVAELLCENEQCRDQKKVNFLRGIMLDFTERFGMSCPLQARSDHWYLASGKRKNPCIFFCRFFC